MRSTIVAAAGLALASAVPLESRQSTPNDAQILNYALTLEHLESTFYNLTLSMFSAQDFQKAGLPSTFYSNLKEIAFDEATHVDFLTGALTAGGYQATAECTYDFGFDTVDGFLKTAALLEGVGVSAYLGAAQYISNKAYLTAAGSILTVEARHSAFFREHQNPNQSPFPAPFDIALGFDDVYSLAVQFITSCPSSNPPLPVKAFPPLTLLSYSPDKAGITIALKPATPVNAAGAFFITALGPVAATVTKNGDNYDVVIPSGVQAGQEYLVLTSDTNTPTDENVVAGPAVVQIVDNISGADQQWEHGHNWGWNGYGNRRY